MSWPIKEKAISELFLDQKNIRTPISDKDQNALIKDMFSNEKAYDLVKSYVQNGVFPDEFPIAIEEDDKYVVIEGNRRLAALKALHEPDIVPSYKNRIKKLADPDIKAINVVIAPSREAAIKHIANKHTINYRKPWKPLRQAYFYKSQIDNGLSIDELMDDYPDHDIPRFIKMLEMHKLAKSVEVDETHQEKVHDERKFPITNLERFYKDSNVKEFLGIEFDEYGRVNGKIDTDEFYKGYEVIVNDIASGRIDSRRVNTKSEMKKYLKGLPKEVKPDKSKEGKFNSDDFEVKEPENKNGQDKNKKSNHSFPKGLFRTKELPFNAKSNSLKFIYNELRTINVKRFPNATHDLLRSFLECSLVNFLKNIGDYDSAIKQADQHVPKLSEMLTYISKDEFQYLDDSTKEVVKTIKSKYDQDYSLPRMNMINHNENWAADEKEIRVAWSRIEKLMVILLNPEDAKDS